MGAIFHDEIEIEDFEWDGEFFTYPCPCGDEFQITLEDLENGEDIATCPSCSLIIRVIYDDDSLSAVKEKSLSNAGGLLPVAVYWRSPNLKFNFRLEL